MCSFIKHVKGLDFIPCVPSCVTVSPKKSNSGEIWQDSYQIDSQVDFARLTSKYVYFGPSMSTVRTTVVNTEHLIYLHNSRLLINRRPHTNKNISQINLVTVRSGKTALNKLELS